MNTFIRYFAKLALAGSNYRLATISHPSPASPKANRGWAELVEKELSEHGLSGILPRKSRK
jgi:single-strand selective monofunctional uracil DNA glycosylase